MPDKNKSCAGRFAEIKILGELEERARQGAFYSQKAVGGPQLGRFPQA